MHNEVVPIFVCRALVRTQRSGIQKMYSAYEQFFKEIMIGIYFV